MILNHSRWIYSNLIKILHSLGITILVQDTKGGMVTTNLIKEYLTYNYLESNLKYINVYFIWTKKINIDFAKINPKFNSVQR